MSQQEHNESRGGKVLKVLLCAPQVPREPQRNYVKKHETGANWYDGVGGTGRQQGQKGVSAKEGSRNMGLEGELLENKVVFLNLDFFMVSFMQAL